MSYEHLKSHFEARLKLLSRGILPPMLGDKPLNKMVTVGLGAGPQGSTFHLSHKGDNPCKSMVSTTIYSTEHHMAPYSLKSRFGEEPGTLEVEDDIVLTSRTIPKFFQTHNRGEKMIPAMIHCYGTCTTVMGFECRHAMSDESCKYCEIYTVGMKVKDLPARDSNEALIQAFKAADQYDDVSSITVTSGSFDEPDLVVKRFIELLKEAKGQCSNSFHIQFEPVKDLSLYRELANYADSVGIFLEVFNEDIRREICPGKARTSLEEYLKNWEEAVKQFGRGNVMTTCMLGFGVDYDEIVRKVERFAELGVKSSLLFIRPLSEQLKGYIPDFVKRDLKEISDLFLEVGKIHNSHGIPFKRGAGAGCIGCQGCTAMAEACELAALS